MSKLGRGVGGGHKGLKSHRGMKAPKPPMSPSQVPARAGSPAGGAAAIKITAPKDLAQFGHKVPTLKTLTTDRGAFKLKG